MASGSFVKYIGWHDSYIKLWWSSTQVPGKNQSYVNVYMKFYRQYQINSSANKAISVTVNGTTYKSTKKGWGGKGWTDEFGVVKNAIVTHGADGRATIKIGATVQIACNLSGKWIEKVTLDSTSCKLDNLVTKSSFTLSKDTVSIGDTITVNLKRSSSSVRHDITAKVGDKTLSILSKSNDDGTTTAYSYTLKPADFLPNMAGQSATVSVTCTTYNGTTSYGSTSGSFMIKIRDTDRPAITDANVTVAPSPIAPNTATGLYIQGKTAAKITVNPTITLGDAGKIKNYKVVINGETKTYTSAPIITSALTKSGTNTIAVYVMDGRGMTSNVITKTFQVTPYSTPFITGFSIARCLANGTLNKTGTYVKITASLKYATCGGNNKLNVVIKQKNVLEANYTITDQWTRQTTTSIEKIYSGFSVDNSFDFAIIVTDTYGAEATAYTDIGTEELIMDFSPTGVAIGKVVEREKAFEVELPSYFNNTIYGTVQANTSDARLKDIVSCNLMELVPVWNELQVVLFRYNTYKDTKIQAGLIAQDVIQLFDKYGLDWNEYGVVYETTDGYYSLNYDFINRLTIYIVQGLQRQILDMNNRLERLEK